MFLHFIPAHELVGQHCGTYKDVISRVRWLQRRFQDYRQVAVYDDCPGVVDAAWAEGHPLEGALVEFSLYPRIVKRLKQRSPSTCVAVRSINLEPLQHLDGNGWWPRRGPLWTLYGMGRLLARDIEVKRTADVILSINDWENRVYWDRLPGRARVEWLPYRCPDQLVPAQPLPYELRRTIACVPTSHKNRKSWDLVVRFQRFASALKQRGSRHEFVVTGNLREWGLPACPAVKYSGFLDDLPSFLGACKAVALLSPLGYGVKTTIIDALASGAQVLAHPSLVRRSPSLVRPFLLTLDNKCSRDLDAVEEALTAAPRGEAVQRELRERADATMGRCFGTSAG
jgi:hypothetical protein